MRFQFTKHFKKEYKDLPAGIKSKFEKQLDLLSKDFRHPSLHTKKMQGHKTIWEGRLDYHYRFTFQVEGDTLLFRKIGTHDILNQP